ncbi:amino acid adenylation domain-containing protein [Thalassomonas viridans]|uniref:Amino acid adenylation domain-containing protein n=1 Tax=Thalassomonas viridans TaxID=137584 RepID=A0AAF0C6Y2_9GAMM|nr:amino acid adenylation domain-containing protein [Thalassomonas viridans]WDE02776.1 amino acid adenylation domain-containing protein [Thalassomonas viridans]
MSTNKLTKVESVNQTKPSPYLIKSSTAKGFKSQFKHLKTGREKESFLQEPLQELPLSDRILFEFFGQGVAQSPDHHLIHQAIEQYASLNPNAIAVTHLGSSISYGQLNQKAELLAKKLISLGVKPGDKVGLFLTRSIAMVVGILAVLKLGAAYVPQHLGVTKDKQLLHIIKVANIKVILTLSDLAHLLPPMHSCHLVWADEVIDGKTYQHLVLPDLSQYRDGSLLSFVLFTSGTTGQPNGVCVSHRNLCNIVLTAPGNLAVQPGQKVAQVLSIAFDMAAWEIFTSLAHGATLCIRGKKVCDIDPDVETIIATPSILAMLNPADFQQIKCVAVAGEPCPKPLADLWSGYCCFYNSCGPTETTIVNTMQDYRPEQKPLTIGSPTPNNTVYVLDENEKPCRIGETGVMWAGGECVTWGYLGNDELTGQRYKQDPFIGDGAMMFRTGDLGRWNADGELEHLGRIDDQVKVKGFRVELDSVSACLEHVPGCRQAVTLKLDKESLIAFVSPAEQSMEALQQAALQGLPYYAVPKAIIPLAELPVTPRGKVDKRALLAGYQANEYPQAKPEQSEQVQSVSAAGDSYE